MEQISKPLTMSEAENRARLRESERRLAREGSPYGNRRERRLAARHARRERRQVSEEVSDAGS